MRAAKWIAGFVAGLALLAVAGGLLLTRWIDPNVLRAPIERAVRNATGRELSIRGPLEFDWFPWLAVRTGAAHIAGPGTDWPPLASWRQAYVGVRLVPLLRGKIRVDRVRVDGLVIRLIKAADGRTSWAGFAPRRSAAGDDREFQIAGLELQDARIEYRDLASGGEHVLAELNLTTSAYSGTAPLAINGRAQYVRGTPWPLVFAAAIDSNNHGLQLTQLAIEQTDWKLRLRVPALSIDPARERYRAASWSIDAPGLDLHGAQLTLALAPRLDAETAF
ncbi:MAG: AsmA family protein, partial [Gammaproteobacteria bacterium]|nr:AsmA family protein [Gammaproteobacteria bacterium]